MNGNNRAGVFPLFPCRCRAVLRYFNNLCILTAIACIAPPVSARVELASYIQDEMVVQRGAQWQVAGTSDSDASFDAKFIGQTVKVHPASGGWVARFDVPANFTGAAKLVIDGGRLVRQVQVGDVWLCSGQSNMSWMVRQASDRDLIAESARGKPIHVLTVRRPFHLPQLNTGRWMESASDRFSAVCLAFGAALYGRVNVPLGLIDASVPGTWIESWISAKSLSQASSVKSVFDRYEKAATQRMEKGLRPDVFGIDKPSELFEMMIQPLGQQAVKGVLWYQGEGSGNNGNNYEEMLSLLMRDWRALWNKPAMPFVVMQMPGFGTLSPGLDAHSGWATIRDAQRIAVASSQPAGLVVTVDLGEGSIHPSAKLPFGQRAADVAFELVYDQEHRNLAPVPTSVSFEDKAVRIEFDKGRACLEGTEHLSDTFYVATGDRHWQKADADIRNGSVFIHSADVSHPVAVRYAWSDYPQVGLQGCGTATPVTPFRTDNWP